YSPRAARFLPGGGYGADVLVAGGLAGDGGRDELVGHARAVGTEAARRALASRAARLNQLPTRVDPPAPAPPAPEQPAPGSDWSPGPDRSPVPVPELAVDEHPALFRGRTHGMVDFSEDVSSKDIALAAAEGYDSVELVKRYTTATMGPAQGKLETVNTVAVLAEATGRTIAETGTTTWRPVHVPVTLGALAGRIFEPVRYSPMQPWHASHGAKPLVAGQWIRPEHYGDPAAEVRAVRERVGIIDVTPIGKLDLRGPDVPALLNLLYVNKWSKLGIGRVRYGVMCAEDGVVFDDGVTGRLGEDHYLMSTTSSGAGAVWEWVENWLQTEHPEWRVHVTPVTTGYASINVAGPRSRELLGRLVEEVDLSPEAFEYMHVRTGRVAGVDDCVLWRIGFTGELSYELHVPAGYGPHVWEALLTHGADLGVAPFGVEAQRILRLEKGHLIVGQDTDGLTRAYSAGLDWAVKLDKPDFVGRTELAWQHERDLAEPYGPRLVGLAPVDPSVVPPEASQLVAGPSGTRIVGRITSSRLSPTLGRAVCLAQLDVSLAAPGTEVTVRLPDGRTVAARVTEQLAAVDPAGARQRVESAGPVGPCREFTAPAPDSPVVVAPPRATGPVTLTDESALAKVLVRAAVDGPVGTALGTRFGRAARDPDGSLVVGSAPGEWLVLGERAGRPAALAARLSGLEELVSVVDVTHGRALLRLTGPRAADLLAKVCAIDLADDATPDGAALCTSTAKLVTGLVRDDMDGTPSYLVHCERSSGQYLCDALLDAGAEFGINTAG
ncbi:MAG: sarcosine oxidase, subunit alpha, partial [Pseudonocardiales bacterium]|nr:sarcosine oxidase, subunit alpha [Pseudonocardiales bacterium]